MVKICKYWHLSQRETMTLSHAGFNMRSVRLKYGYYLWHVKIFHGLKGDGADTICAGQTTQATSHRSVSLASRETRFISNTTNTAILSAFHTNKIVILF